MNSSQNLPKMGGARPGAGRKASPPKEPATSCLVLWIQTQYARHVETGGTLVSFTKRAGIAYSQLWPILHGLKLPSVELAERIVQSLGGTIVVTLNTEPPQQGA